MSHSPPQIDISVQSAPIRTADECCRFFGRDDQIGATALFIGTVRGGAVHSMTLEHYPEMTEQALADIVAAADERWALLGVRVVHRVGVLAVGDVIVFVGVAARHRADAFAACQYITDFLKSRAPFWKKESTAQGERWVEAVADDEAALLRWRQDDKKDED